MHPLATRFVPLAVLAVAGIAVAGWTALKTVHPQAVPPVAAAPTQGPWEQRISASGLIEGDGNDTRIGVPEQALIAAVAVHIGQQVKAGDLLFSLDDRLAQADLAVAQADVAATRGDLVAAQAGLASAQAGVARLAAMPRADDAAPVAARVAVAEAQLADAKTHRLRIEKLGAGAATAEEIDVRRGIENVAKAEVASAQADLAHAKLPAWAPDLTAAQAEVALARARVATVEARIAAAAARVAAIQVRLGRLAVRSPRAATVIATTAMPGAVASPDDPGLVVLADLQRLLVRLEIDESQVGRLSPGAAGKGWLRGDRSRPLDLAFERIEPRAEARRALAGRPGERLDGRAVQVLYRIVDPPPYLRPGLLIEADIEVARP